MIGLIKALYVTAACTFPNFYDYLCSQHVPGSAATVNIQGYIVQWLQEGQNWTEWKESRQTEAEVSIGPGQYNFTVQAVVQMGSTPPAHITIPQRDDGGEQHMWNQLIFNILKFNLCDNSNL